MTTPAHNPGGGGTSDRVRCAYCGANNFPASPACWQCGRPLRPLSASAAGASPMASNVPSPAPVYSAPSRPLDSTVAPKAAAALGLMFPWAAVPIGLAFLMLDDPRKARLGWIAIGWSVPGTILNVFGTVLSIAPFWPFLKTFLAQHGSASSTGNSGGLSGIPSLGGSSLGLFLHVRLLFMF